MKSTANYPSCKEIENHAEQEMEKLFEKVPFSREFHEGKSTDYSYYKRHLLETIVRIGLNNEVDAYCLYKIGHSDNQLAQKLSTYLAEEYGHDSFFLSDLRRFGLAPEDALSTPPLFSTQLLIGYLYYSINQDGSMPTMVWNWIVEWYSNRYNMKITRKAEEEFGSDKVKGSLGHLQYDQDQNHVELMYSTVERVMKVEKDGERVKQYVTNFISLIGMYFQELHDLSFKQISVKKLEKLASTH
jgi:hypothetical protein